MLDYQRRRAAGERRPAHPATWVTLAAALGGFAIIAAGLLYLSRTAEGLLFVLWCGGPLLLVGGLAIVYRRHLLSQLLLLLAAVALNAVTWWAVGQMNKDAQGGLVLIFAPIYLTWPIAVITTIVVSVFWAVRRKEKG